MHILIIIIINSKINSKYNIICLSLTPDELLSHQELDILFDNDGSFTIEESKVIKNIVFLIFEILFYL
jgi:hypothetical protein